MKKYLIILLVLFLLVFTSCSSSLFTSNEHTSVHTSNEEDSLREQPSSNAPSYSDGYTLSQASIYSGCSVFIKKGDTFYPIDSYNLVSADYYADEDIFGIGVDDSKLIPTLDLSAGDTLVTFENVTSYPIASVEDSCYCFPIDVIRYNKLEFSYGHHILEPEYHQYTDEVAGIQIRSQQDLELALETVDGFLLDIDPDSIFETTLMCSSRKSSLSAGYYSNTTWTEYTIGLDTPLYFFPDMITYPVAKTKLGYFIIDTEALGSGSYVLNSSNTIWGNSYCLFNVV